MKAITKRFLALFLSLIIIIAPTIQQANAASSWSITSAVSAGSRSVVSATKSGYKSAVNIAPTAGRLSLKLVKGANWAALVYAAIQLAPDVADIDSFRPEYSNDRVAYDTKPLTTPMYSINAPADNFIEKNSNSETLCKSYVSKVMSGWSFVSVTYDYSSFYKCNFKNNSTGQNFSQVMTRQNETIPSKTEYISIPAAAAQMIKNADAGHSLSKAATLETATEMVIGGQFDQDLLSGAVPTSDNKPLVPSVPISGNGNVTHGADIGVGDSGMSGASPGDQADAAKDAADAAKKAGQAAVDAAKDAANAASDAADAAADLVNSGADTAAVDAANAKAAEAAKAAADSKAVSDAAVAAANDRAAAAERAAEAATESAQAAAEKAAADVAAAKASGDTAAQAAAEAAKEAADAAVAAAKEKQAAAEKAAEKAKAEATKPFELPAFCTWAAIVCETAEWLKREPEVTPETPIEIEEPISDFDSDKSYITFTGGCPPKYTASLNIMGATAPFEFDYTPICTVMSYLKPFIVGAGYIAAAYIIAGHSRGSKD